MPRKNFTAPVWWLAVALVFQLLFLISFYVVTRQYEGTGVSFASTYITRGAYIALIVGEGVFYWQYRARIRIRRFAWCHIVGMILAFIVFPLFQTWYSYWLTISSGAGDARDKFILFNQISTIVFWSLFIIAHLFFVLLIGKGLGVAVAEEEEEETTNGQDILTPYEDRV